MPWNLEVNTIDVGQGESSLIIAHTDDNSQFKSVLIDGGLLRYGKLVHDYVAGRLGPNRTLDLMITTHYDEDHSEGHISMMKADNLSIIASVIGNAVATAIKNAALSGNSGLKLTAMGGAAFGAVISGAYKLDSTTDYSYVVSDAADYARSEFETAVLRRKPKNAQQAVRFGIEQAFQYILGVARLRLPPSLMVNSSKGSTFIVAKAVINTILNEESTAYVLAGAKATQVFFDTVGPPATQAAAGQTQSNYGFFTNQIYKNTKVYSNGNVINRPVNNNLPTYLLALKGKVDVYSLTATAPDLGRGNELVPQLGQELLGIADTAAPKMYCVAVGARVLKPGTGPVRSDTVTGDALNAISIGVIIVFNNFVYYTGGDLPVDGLNNIPAAVLNNARFNNAQGRAPQTIPVYKTGHHGSTHSNSAAYLSTTKTRSAFISSGSKSFDEEVIPSQPVIDLLRNAATLKYYYLTNCKVIRDGVPGSNGEQQLVKGNKSRICGDNEFDQAEEVPEDYVFKPKVHRGDIVMKINEAASRSILLPPAPLPPGGAYRQFRVTYWEEEHRMVNGVDLGPTGVRTEIITF